MEREYPNYSLKLDKILQVCAARRGDPDFIDLCLGASRFQPASFMDLNFDEKDFAHSFLYGDLQGMRKLRDGLKQLYDTEFGIEVPSDRFLITDGASGALYIAFLATLATGDEVILPRVCFPVYKIFAQMIGAKCIFAPVNDRFVYDVKSLAPLITGKTKTIVINSPSNPSMGILTASEISEILSLGLNVISDEVYNLLMHNAPAQSLLKFTDQHFVVNSFSKSHASAGLRIGHLVMPEKYVDLALSIKASLNICTSLPAQIFAQRILSSHESIISAHRNYLQENYLFFRELCTEYDLPVLNSSPAGFFSCIKVQESAFELALELIRKENVAVCPSPDFGDPDPLFLRLNYSVSREHLLEGIRRIAPYV